MNTLHGRRIVVTGATGGLGPTLVESCLALGAEVVAVGRLRTKLDALRAALKQHERLDIAEADLSTRAGAEALIGAVERAGGVHGLVHAVGSFAYGPVTELDEETIDRLIAGNAMSTLWTVRAAVAAMRERRDGSVVIIGSDRAFAPGAGFALYGAAKAFATHLAQAVAQETKDVGVRVNVIAPGTIDTEENRRSMPEEDPAEWVAPLTIAKSTAWLLGPDASSVSGSVIRCVG